MNPRLAADAVLLLHAAFIVFVVFGALPALRWRWWPLVHLPALAWGLWIEVSGGLCPLTLLEDEWRRRSGQQGLPGGFVERTVLPLIYPDGLTRPTQWVLAGLVLGINLVVYTFVVRRHRWINRR